MGDYWFCMSDEECCSGSCVSMSCTSLSISMSMSESSMDEESKVVSNKLEQEENTDNDSAVNDPEFEPIDDGKKEASDDEEIAKKSYDEDDGNATDFGGTDI